MHAVVSLRKRNFDLAALIVLFTVVGSFLLLSVPFSDPLDPLHSGFVYSGLTSFGLSCQPVFGLEVDRAVGVRVFRERRVRRIE